MGPDTSGQRLAIFCYQPDLCEDPGGTEAAMKLLAERLGFTFPEPCVFEIDLYRRGAWATVGTAIVTTRADAVITVDLDHVYGIDKYIRERVPLITLEGETILQRAEKRAAVHA